MNILQCINIKRNVKIANTVDAYCEKWYTVIQVTLMLLDQHSFIAKCKIMRNQFNEYSVACQLISAIANIWIRTPLEQYWMNILHILTYFSSPLAWNRLHLLNAKCTLNVAIIILASRNSLEIPKTLGYLTYSEKEYGWIFLIHIMYAAQ